MKKTTTKLTMRPETIRVLTSSELHLAVGGSVQTSVFDSTACGPLVGTSTRPSRADTHCFTDSDPVVLPPPRRLTIP